MKIQIGKKGLKFILGVFLILIVDVIWVLSSEGIQFIFKNLDFSKPFFLTFANTGLFTIYLSGFFFIKSWRMEFAKFLNEDTSIEEDENSNDDARSDEVRTEDSINDYLMDKESLLKTEHHTFKKTVIAAITLCPLWVMANVSFNFSLAYTSVSSNTIISNTSSLFCFIIGFIIGIDPFSFSRLFSIFFCIGGVVIIALSDISEGKDSIVGNVLSLFSAFMYAMYTTWIKLVVPENSNISMPMLFGLMGLFNLAMLWPLFFIFHWIGLETFTLPSGWTIYVALLIQGFIGTVFSDILWAFSVVLTNSSVISTLGLSLTIPLGILFDVVILGRKPFRWEFLIGGILVGIGFIFVNLSYHWPKSSRINAVDSPKFCTKLHIPALIKARFKSNKSPAMDDHLIS